MRVFECGDWVFDFEQRRISHAGQERHLTPKALEVLEFLIEQAPRAVSKKELLDQVWPDVVVTPNSLTAVIAELRAALHDTVAGSSFIRTVHRFGYAFSAQLTTPVASGRAFLAIGRRTVTLREGENVIGRDPAAPVFINDSTVSRHHARIVLAGATAQIEDLGSKNGTRVGGTPVTHATPLIDGDEVRVGDVQLVFRIGIAGASTETARGL